jgi:hypothetical protein
MNLLTYLHSIF